MILYYISISFYKNKIDIEQKEIQKETDKTYIVNGLGGRTHIRKTQINVISSEYSTYIYCLDLEEGKKILHKFITEKIAKLKNDIETYQKFNEELKA